MKKIMHALYKSSPLCGFSEKLAKNWPRNHDWFSYRDIDEITCASCKEKAKALIKKESEGTTVYLLVGQRGSGKSSYGKKLMDQYPDLKAISRDEILIRLLGSVNTDPYSGGIYFAYEIMYKLISRRLKDPFTTKLILDAWTTDSNSRKQLIKKLREYGASKIIALYFVTPLNLVEKWFWKKPGIAKISEMGKRKDKDVVFFPEYAPKHDYEVFHKSASDIESDGFDQVIKINPTKNLISLG